MPIYVYQILNNDGSPGAVFEVSQSMSEPALTHHPETGEPVRRVVQAPHLSCRHTPGKTRNLLDNSRVAKAGFTKYERDKLTGTYHRVAGKEGPASFKKPPPEGLS